VLPHIATHFSFLAWSVCLSVVCHVRAPFLNRSTYLGLTYILCAHGYTSGVQVTTVSNGSSWHYRERRDLEFEPAAKACSFFRFAEQMICHSQVTASSTSDSAFYRITSVLFFLPPVFGDLKGRIFSLGRTLLRPTM